MVLGPKQCFTMFGRISKVRLAHCIRTKPKVFSLVVCLDVKLF